MTRHELISQNKILREEKQKIYQQINDIKQKMEPVYILAVGLESEIKYYSKDIAQDKAWIRSETQSLNNIKNKISEEYNYLSELNGKLEGLYREKSSAYDCKNYDRVSRIKSQIENVKARKRNTVDRIESLKRDKKRQADYISRMINANKERQNKVNECYEKRNQYLAYIFVLKEERNNLFERLKAIKSQIEQNDRLIKNR